MTKNTTTKKAERKPETRPVCPNCGQWQHDNLKGYLDCFHECAKLGFAPRKATPAAPQPAKAAQEWHGEGADWQKIAIQLKGNLDTTRAELERVKGQLEQTCDVLDATAEQRDYYKQQRDEVLAALKELRDAAIRNGFESEAANVAIANAEKRAQD